ncbi:SapC family protein [Salinimonas sediminis]|uniref:Peptidase n=1 Tax=Salinimonas sediminis TaxID=2303538 RepID=A0A346NRG1_9ALTE|nr:SapC family protein [Salinimonas sediminis]AXR08118.1 peptidase [Salinimonas sediminis]
MAKHVLLNNLDHQHLHVEPSAATYDYQRAMCVPLYPAEARLAQAQYPLLFAKDAQGAFQLVALTGLQEGENVFVSQGTWQANYTPLVAAKGPFVIGRSQPDSEQLSIHIDLDHPSVSEQSGEPIFLPHGGNTDYIDHIANLLSTLHESLPQHAALISACEQLNLIESFVLDIELPSSGTHRLSGFYTVNEPALQALSAQQLKDLQQQGHLETLYMVLASQSQINTLVQRRQAAPGH